MAEHRGSVRPNSISSFDACRLLHTSVKAVAAEPDPAPWHCVHTALIEMFAKGDKADYVRQTKLWERSKLLMHCALLRGELKAHFSDGREARDIPGWAWANTEQIWLPWLDNRLSLDALLPDDWQRWSCLQVFIDKLAFDCWIDRQDLSSIAGLPNLPPPYDEGEKPIPVERRLPTDRPFVTLSEALSWIAFGTSFDRDRLIRAIDGKALGNSAETQAKLERAVIDLATLASGGKIAVRGKYVTDHMAGGSTALTEAIDPVRFHDFTRFDCFADALRYGQGLTWKKGDTFSQILLSKRSDAFESVAVNRADLLRHFPESAQFVCSAQSTTGGVRECKEWLTQEFASDPEKRRSKADFRDAALAAFPGRLSKRGFDLTVWPELSRQHGRDSAGAKKKS